MKSVELFLAKQTCCNLSPVFDDYRKHFDALNVTHGLESEGMDSADEDSSSRSSDNKGISYASYYWGFFYCL